MRKILLILFTVILFLIFVSWYNANPRVIISQLIKNKGISIKTGQLRYRVYLLKIFPIGEAILGAEDVEEYKGQKVYHLNGTANNSRLFSHFFKAYATLDSYIEMQQLNPILFKQKLVVTGKPDLYREVFYDQTNHIMSIEGVRRQILPNTQDPLSLIFNIKHMDFNKIKELEMNINTNQKNYILKGIVQSRDISIHKKTYKIAFLETTIKRRDKSPYHQSRISIVLLKDKENIPILIKIFASGMLINARLIDIQ